MIAQILFILLLGVASFFAYKRFAFVKRNILLGRDIKPEGPNHSSSLISNCSK